MNLVPSPAAAPLQVSRSAIAATVVAGAVTLLLLTPGVLSGLSDRGAEPPIETIEAQKAITRALEDKVSRVRNGLQHATCTPDGRLVPGSEGEVVPPIGPLKSSFDANPAAGDSAWGMALVARIATQSVVFILVTTESEPAKGDGEKPESASVRTGSGFFIGPDTVVTNAHVIDGATTIWVANHFLGRVKRAKLEAQTTPTQAFDADFAVLKVDAGRPVPAIPIAMTATRLMDVVAAGYPAIVSQLDPQFAKLVDEGDPSAAPEVTTFPGFITSIQDENGPSPNIIHSAALAHGNSGGPLLDLCGRAIAVNTAKATREEDLGYIVNSALSARALAAFLDKQGVAYQKSETGCGKAPVTPPAR